MSRLLSAGFARMFKNRLFWMLTGFMFLLGVAIPVSDYGSVVRAIAKGYAAEMDIKSVFFQYPAVIGFVSAVFTGLFLGEEYNSGAIRNKLIVGHRRKDIYLSGLIFSACAAAVMCLAYILACCAVGIPLLGGFEGVGAGWVIVIVLCTLLMTCAYGAIYTLIAMLCQSKSATAVICLVLMTVMFLAGSIIQSRLAEPEFYDGYAMYDAEIGQIVVQEEPEPNPSYVGGNTRVVLEFLDKFLPMGQSIHYSNMDPGARPWEMPLYSLIIIVATTGIGMMSFKKKDIK